MQHRADEAGAELDQLAGGSGGVCFKAVTAQCLHTLTAVGFLKSKIA